MRTTHPTTDPTTRPTARTRRALAPLAATVAVALAASGLAWAGAAVASRGPSGRPGTTPSSERPGDLERYADASADAYEAAFDAYVWGAPLVAMSRTRARLTCIAPVNRLLNVPRLSTPADRTVVAPNVDTLYSTAWLDLRSGPVTLDVPAMPDRYYVFQLLDMYTNTFANVGTRTTGRGAGRFAIVGPGWRGPVPAGARVLRSPTPDVWLLGRTLVRGPDDVPNVVAVQRRYVLSAPTPPTPPPAPDCTNLKSPQDLLADGVAFLDELGRVMAADPPPARDHTLVRRLARAGIGPGRTPSTGTDPVVLDGLARGLAAGEALVARHAATPQAPVGGWTTNRDIGTYGSRFVTRAVVARNGLAANVPEESVYYRAAQDAAGTRLDGRNRYRIHFAAGQLPPVGDLGFWSITMYDQTFFLVDNPIDRYAVGDRTPGLVRNADGSLDVYVGSTPPAGHESNWLPAPATPFTLAMRVYLPTPAVLAQTWKPPTIHREG
jgi:hypothetical protein